MMENPITNIFFPEHPVGVGAKWEITNPSVKLGGIDFSYKSSHELVSLEGDTATIDSTLSQNADEQTVKFPGSNFESKIEAYKSTGSGKMNIKFDELLSRGSANAQSEVATVIQPGDGQETRVISNMDMSIEITD